MKMRDLEMLVDRYQREIESRQRGDGMKRYLIKEVTTMAYVVQVPDSVTEDRLDTLNLDNYKGLRGHCLDKSSQVVGRLTNRPLTIDGVPEKPEECESQDLYFDDDEPDLYLDYNLFECDSNEASGD